MFAALTVLRFRRYPTLNLASAGHVSYTSRRVEPDELAGARRPRAHRLATSHSCTVCYVSKDSFDARSQTCSGRSRNLRACAKGGPQPYRIS